MSKLKEYFKVHRLNKVGLGLCDDLAQKFEELAKFIDDNGVDCRQKSVALTKLEEACFFAKKSIASNPNFQE